MLGSGFAKLRNPSKFANEIIKEDKKDIINEVSKINKILSNYNKLDSDDCELILMIDSVVVEEANEEMISRGVRKGRFHPSNMGNNCDRLLYLNYHGMIPINLYKSADAQGIRRLDNGHYLENRFWKYFLKLNMLLARETRVEIQDPPMSGRIDFTIQLPDREYPTLLELKSINSRGFGQLDSSARKDHEAQLQCYLNMSDNEHGIVFYENKDNQKFKEFHIYRDEKFWQEEVVERCHKIMEMKKIPKAPANHSTYCGCIGYDKNAQ